MTSVVHSEQRFNGYQPSLFRDDQVFADCEFDHVIAQGALLSGSVFSNCTFQGLDWYWCQAFRAVFVSCKFIKCDLRGNFDETKFISCLFVACRYDQDNLGKNQEWAGAVSILCDVEGAPLPIIESYLK